MSVSGTFASTSHTYAHVFFLTIKELSVLSLYLSSVKELHRLRVTFRPTPHSISFPKLIRNGGGTTPMLPLKPIRSRGWPYCDIAW